MFKCSVQIDVEIENSMPIVLLLFDTQMFISSRLISSKIFASKPISKMLFTLILIQLPSWPSQCVLTDCSRFAHPIHSDVDLLSRTQMCIMLSWLSPSHPLRPAPSLSSWWPPDGIWGYNLVLGPGGPRCSRLTKASIPQMFSFVSQSDNAIEQMFGYVFQTDNAIQQMFGFGNKMLSVLACESISLDKLKAVKACLFLVDHDYAPPTGFSLPPSDISLLHLL